MVGRHGRPLRLRGRHVAREYGGKRRRAKLVAAFDRVCGDTICSGDYSNLSTVRLACSSTRAAKRMKDCFWVLGGKIDHVDGRTGELTSEARMFACHVPVASNAKSFLAELLRRYVLRRRLPRHHRPSARLLG